MDKGNGKLIVIAFRSEAYQASVAAGNYSKHHNSAKIYDTAIKEKRKSETTKCHFSELVKQTKHKVTKNTPI